MSADINLKRIYLPGAKEDGYQILVDKLWPRGMNRESAEQDEWIKEVAPSSSLITIRRNGRLLSVDILRS